MRAELIALVALTIAARAAGPFPGGPGAPDSDAIPAASTVFTGWATGIASFTPGPRQAGSNAASVSYGSAASVTGPADAAGATYPSVGPNPILSAPVLSLGDGGSVTLTFATHIADGEGADFAVFENGFGVGLVGVFAELAFVEVSSNGVDFVRFPAVSCTQTATQLGNFSTLDPTTLYNLAGKHPAGYGTPFDLAEIAGTAGINTARITHVRLVDVVGDVLGAHGSRDSLGNFVNDPWPTNFQTSGFDLDAVGVIHQAADPWQPWLADPDADPDGDGRSNLVEWAVDSAPDVPDAAPPLQITARDNGIRLSFHRAARPGLSLGVEQSENGLDWEPLASGTQSGDITVETPRSGGRMFYRLRVERRP